MKNKLITGIASVAICAGFASCSHHDFEPMTQAEIDQANYEAAFIKRFGQPDPNHTWGFGTTTRATRAAQTNRNEWYDENYYNLEEPKAITDAERDYVMTWFAEHGKADGKTLDIHDYFVMQVGYGERNYTVTGNVYEKYENNTAVFRQETSDVQSKNHMNYFYACLDENGRYDEINNFNAGSGDVMLMQNSETKYGFGFRDSWGTDDTHIYRNYLMAEIDVPGIGKGWYVGFDYQTQKKANYTYWDGSQNVTVDYTPFDLKPDGKYDDRVLKIVPAKKKVIQGDIRVIAEDLTVDEKGDFDFNDVVFDVKYNCPAGKTTIILQAAGGTLPLTVGGVEVHEKFGVATTTMVNTGAGVSKEPVTFVLDQQYSNANDIPVMVQKDEEWVLLTAVVGRVPRKIGVDTSYEWCGEREDIAKKYPLFGNWIANQSVGDAWHASQQ